MKIFRFHPELIGGCRPIELEKFINPESFDLEYRNLVIAFGVPSEVIVARTKYIA
jgi:hypothetical protein